MKLETRLTRLLGKEKVFVTLPMREMYAYDSSPFISKPDMVVFVVSTNEVACVMGLAHEYGVPVLARGAGTCLSGGGVPIKGGISLVMTQMNVILEIDPVSRTALVEPGVVNLSLQKALAPHGLIFPPDPASQKVATIGGNVAECAGGIQGAKYGVTKNYVLGLELVLSNGTITTTGLLSEAETLGSDMTGIFNGSEGSMAVITKILVSCLPKPQSMRTALASFASLNDAAKAVSAIIKQGIIPTALELMDQTMLRAVDDFTKIGFPKDAQAVLLMEVDGYEMDLDPQLALMKEICTTHHAADVKLAVNLAERENLWKARRSGNGALGRIRPAYMVHDVTVPRHQVACLLTRIQEIGKAQGIIIAQMAHAGDGNAHPHLLYYPDEEKIQQRLHDATLQIFKVALELGGTISGEHGIGLEKKAYMGMQFSSVDLAFMKKIQKAMDPTGILNPGKIFPSREEAETTDLIQGSQGIHQTETGPGRSIEYAGPGQILEFIPDNLTIKVRGDTPLWKVQATAATINAFLPLCTHTQGNDTMSLLMETGARGNDAFALGSLKEYIYGLEFTTWSGEWISTGGHTAKNVAGYDLTRLLWKSMGTIGSIQTLTLKLVPRPARQRLLVEKFSNLGDCIAYAKALLRADICLCTLKVHGQVHKGHQSWQMITGLAGSVELVDLHTETVFALAKKSARQVFDMEGHKSFWTNQAREKALYPFLLLHGAGLRTPMFNFLAQNAAFLGNLNEVRIEMDLGCPELSVYAQKTQTLFACETDVFCTEVAQFPGFFMEWPGKSQRKSLIHARILQCLAPHGAFHMPGNNPKQNSVYSGRIKESPPCPA